MTAPSIDPVAHHLNAMSDEDASEALARCCGSHRWVQAMVAARPYASDAGLFRVADRTWWNLDPDDWLEAFTHHPRIGEREAQEPQRPASATEQRWSSGEQAGMDQAGREVHDAMVEGNLEYEERFGHVFLICATGRSGDEMLAALRARLGNDPAEELAVAAEEQAKITRLRLLKLVET